ncbi:MAG TPA: hypothetical protein VNO30_42755 [Kofleriaceae bacterium]|nr:hypothetical protein [Kofleriaceae bacterium]
MSLRAGAVLWATSALAALAWWCGARDAAACSPIFEPSLLARPAFEPADAARIEAEAVDVDCGLATCRIVATYHIAADREARVTVAGHRVQELTIEIAGGVAVAAAATVIPAGARELRVAATVELWPYGETCYRDGIVSRHPWLATKPPRPQRVLDLEAAARPDVRYPDGWHLKLDQRSMHTRQLGERMIARLWFRLPEPRVLHGGPFVLAGLAGGAGGLVRLRAGWEIAAPRWLILALAADTDVTASAALAVTAESTTRAWIGFPLTSGIGGGPIAALAPEVRPGGRAQASFAWKRARLVLFADVLAPVADDQAIAISAGVLAGVSL